MAVQKIHALAGPLVGSQRAGNHPRAVNIRPAARMNQDFAVGRRFAFGGLSLTPSESSEASRKIRDFAHIPRHYTCFSCQGHLFLKLFGHFALHRRIVVKRPMLFIKSCRRA